MEEEEKICQNCKKDFRIEPDDFLFYEKIGVPPPTWCYFCNMRRLMLWRNERALYKREDCFGGPDVISVFSPDKPFLIASQNKWWSDSWNPLDYGVDYDFSRPFFTQFRELMEKVPLPALLNKNQIDSEHCNHAEDSKNCYLLFASIWNENVSYGKGAINCKDSFDLFFGEKEELAYENTRCYQSYRLAFSRTCHSCRNSMFLIDCKGCENCLGCVNLLNKSYHIFNKPYTKEEYEAKLAEFDLGSFSGLEKFRTRFAEESKKIPRRYADIINSPDSTGDGVYRCKNCKWCFDVTNNVEDSKYIANAGYNLKDSRFAYGAGLGELYYQVVDTGRGGSNVVSSVMERNGTNVRYAYNCHDSSNIFGCIGIRNKSYCVLNKQYSKDDYEKFVQKIIEHMNFAPYTDVKGRIYRYGEFFPPEFAPFAYNETVAQEYFPMTKEQAREQGFLWKDEVFLDRRPATVSASALPDRIEDVADKVLEEIVGCAHEGKCGEQCTVAFRIIPQELAFYRKLGYPLPRLCPNCRHYRRLRQVNTLRLWKRICMCFVSGHFHGSTRCPNEFETPYAPNRSEILYCKACFQNEFI